jgi:hypothetical protein
LQCVQYSEIPIQPTDQEDLSKLLNAPELAELKLRVRSISVARTKDVILLLLLDIQH